MRARVHVTEGARDRAAASGGDPFTHHPPPLDLATDLVLAVGAPPVAPLREAFPAVPFAAVAGRALLGVWFAHVRRLVASGREVPPRPGDLPYRELTVALLRRDGHLFVPAILATSGLSRRIGRRYGMPKRDLAMSWDVAPDGAASRAESGGATSEVRARAIGHGGGAARLAAGVLPTWTPRATFPSGSWIRVRLEGADRLRLAGLGPRRLALDEGWLPRPVTLWPVGLLATDVRMRLPAPGPD